MEPWAKVVLRVAAEQKVVLQKVEPWAKVVLRVAAEQKVVLQKVEPRAKVVLRAAELPKGDRRVVQSRFWRSSKSAWRSRRCGSTSTW